MDEGLLALFCEAFLNGMYTILMIYVLYLFWNKKSLTGHRWLGYLLQGGTIIMYLISLTHLFLAFHQELGFYLLHFFSQRKSSLPYVTIQLSLEMVNCCVADLVLCWRAWALCNHSLKAIMVPSFMIVVTIVTGSIGMTKLARTEHPSSSTTFITSFQAGLSVWLYVMTLTTLLTNLVVTGTIAVRIIQHQRILRGAELQLLPSLYLKVALIVCESGALWMSCLLISLMLALLKSSALPVFLSVTAQLTGIVPTLIVVMVSLKADTISLRDTRMTTVTLPTFIAAESNDVSANSDGGRIGEYVHQFKLGEGTTT
ncbi:hypothetical protein DL96DRAFT_1729046 [Flagelloscypha sp. PMI_526]|nr:hypothetical protein DL96DRAFT_1729046 [Flagelloscypha sp. PMI_526]